MSEVIRKNDAVNYTFKEYRKVGTTKLSNETLPVGTKVETLEGWFTCSEPSRLAIDANGNVYPVAESIFAKTYEVVQSLPAASADAYVWLIERGQATGHSPTIWWCGGDVRAGVGEDEMRNWTEDAQKARRFESKESAETLAQKLFPPGLYSITEHIFLQSAPADVCECDDGDWNGKGL